MKDTRILVKPAHDPAPDDLDLYLLSSSCPVEDCQATAYGHNVSTVLLSVAGHLNFSHPDWRGPS